MPKHPFIMCHMPRIDLGPYRITDATVERPPRPHFDPTYELDADVYDAMRAVERADQELAGRHLDARATRRMLEDALTRNAYGTASIEGNPLTLEDVESLLARGPTPDSMERPEEREILNYVAYMDRLDELDAPRTLDDVLEVHRVLFDGVLEDAGEFKRTPNFIGRRPEYEVVFVPAAPEHVEPELANALDWLHAADEHPLVRAMVFFHEFQSIHPFRDGNGRAGRAITTLVLNSFGYAGVRYALVDYEFNADRDGYYTALSAVERQGFDYTPWVRYMSGVLRRTFEGSVQRLLFREGLPDDLNDRQTDVALWFARLDRDTPGRRVKFNDVHAAFPAIADRTLKRDLKNLRDAGVIVMEGKRRGAQYVLAP